MNQKGIESQNQKADTTQKTCRQDEASAIVTISRDATRQKAEKCPKAIKRQREGDREACSCKGVDLHRDGDIEDAERKD
ncbi:hypothetical protein AA102526_0474 [Asaia lannensis NBRC 102526]|nr:hypothetical protein AA102526_0474 [Asaia lannensis NBRC 102526]